MKQRRESKYIRTVMKHEGQYVTARINKHTGEIKPYKYKEPPKPIKPRAKLDCTPSEPFWVGMVQDERPTRECEILSTKAVENPYFGMLDQYDIYAVRSGGVGQTVSGDHELTEDQMDDAITSLAEHMPFIDDYFTGVAHLDDANPLSKNVMFRLLRTLPEISSNTIYQATNYSERYCQRLATALRVFIKLTT